MSLLSTLPIAAKGSVIEYAHRRLHSGIRRVVRAARAIAIGARHRRAAAIERTRLSEHAGGRPLRRALALHPPEYGRDLRLEGVPALRESAQARSAYFQCHRRSDLPRHDRRAANASLALAAVRLALLPLIPEPSRESASVRAIVKGADAAGTEHLFADRHAVRHRLFAVAFGGAPGGVAGRRAG